MSTIMSIIDRWADEKPEAIALRFLAEGRPDRGVQKWSYAELVLWVDGLARKISCWRGARALLLMPSDQSMVRAFLACCRAGVVAVPVHMSQAGEAPAALARAAESIRDAQPALVLTTAAVREALLSGGCTWPAADVVVEEEVPRAQERVPDAAGRLVLIQYTSGSTGDPKGVMLDHQAFCYQAECLAHAWHSDEDFHVVSWLPLYHDLGLVLGLVDPLLLGGSTTLIPPTAFLDDPGCWLDSITAFRATVTAAPDFAYRLIAALPAARGATWDLSSLVLAVDGGEPVSPSTLRRFAAATADSGIDPGVLAPAYGLAETCLAVAITPRGKARQVVQARRFDAAALTHGHAVLDAEGEQEVMPCGGYYHGWDIRIMDPESGRQLEPCAVGEIWIAGPGLALGYWQAPDATAQTFVQDVHGLQGRYVRTGDLGFMLDGELHICGRLKDVLIIHGANHYPQDLERTLEEAVPGLPPGAACVVQSRYTPEVHAVIEMPERPGAWREDLANELRRAVRAAHGVELAAVSFTPPRSLPRTAAGKVRRVKVADLLEGAGLGHAVVFGSPDARDSMPVELSTRSHLRSFIARFLEVDPSDIHGDTDLVALGMTSLLMADASARLAAAGAVVPLATLVSAPTLDAWWEAVEETRSVVAEPVEESDLRLSPIQQAYILGRQATTLGRVGCKFYAEFELGAVRIDALSRAFEAVQMRHPMLRARYSLEEPQIRITDDLAPLETIDLRDQPSSAEFVLSSLRSTRSHRMLDAEEGEVLALSAVLCSDQRSVLLIECDLLAADAFSLVLVLDELSTAYRDGLESLPPPPQISMSRYQALTSRNEGAARDSARDYWATRCLDLPDGPQLPLAIAPAELAETRFARRSAMLSQEEWQGLSALARELRVTPTVLVATCFTKILAAWASTPVMTLNVTLFDREWVHPDVSHLVGDFTSSMLLASNFQETLSFAENASLLQGTLREGLRHAAYSGVEVARDVRRARGDESWGAPVVFTSNVGTADLGSAFQDVLGTPCWSVSQTPQVWLDHQLTIVDGRAVITWDAVEDLFQDGVLNAMFENYEKTLRVAARGHCPESGMPLPASQLHRRCQANDTVVDLPAGTLHEPILERMRERPQGIAVEDVRGSLTYGELERRCRALASRLRPLVDRPGAPVAISLGKGAEQVVAVLSVLLAGGAYVPVDLLQPPARARKILVDCGAVALLTESGVPWAQDCPCEVIELGSMPDETGQDLGQFPSISPDQLAYVIYTSGSTGQPKGVMISHDAARNTLEDMNRRWRVGTGDKVLALAQLGFDLSVYDILGILAVGGTVVMPDPGRRADPAHWADLVNRHGVTIWNSVPAQMLMLIDYLDATGQRDLASLRVVWLSGDWIPVALPDRVRQHCPHTELVSLGGATEASIWSIHHSIGEVPEGMRSIPYGVPLANQSFHVLDEHLQHCPDWVTGELYIGGRGVALGYLGDQAKTAAAFIEHPGTAQRLYRTGDFGRYRSDGVIEFLGRRDQQVKIRGHRIELAEIEAAHLSDQRIEWARAVVHDEGLPSAAVVSFVMARADGSGSGEHRARVVSSQAVDTLLDDVLQSLPRCAAAASILDMRSEEKQCSEPVRLPGARVTVAAEDAATLTRVRKVIGRSPMTSYLVIDPEEPLPDALKGTFDVLLVDGDRFRKGWLARLEPLATGSSWAIARGATSLPAGRAASGSGDFGYDVVVPLAWHREHVHPEQLRQDLQEHLPGYMVPRHCILLDELPMTENGKVDLYVLRALARRACGDTLPGDEPPRPGLESQVAEVWKKVLNVPRIGRTETFTSLGGDSLKLVQMVGALREAVPSASSLSWEELMRVMGHAPTCQAVAQELATRKSACAGMPAVLRLLAEAGDGPVVVLVHDGAGHTARYRHLVEHLTARTQVTVVGIDLGNPEIFLNTPVQEVIPVFARHYAAALHQAGYRKVHIAGFCIGGFIAVDLAQELRDLGVGVESLTVIDSYRFPHHVGNPVLVEYLFARALRLDPSMLGYPDVEDFAAALPAMFPEGGGEPSDEAKESLLAVQRHLLPLSALPQVDRLSRMSASLGGGITADELMAAFQLFDHCMRGIHLVPRQETEADMLVILQHEEDRLNAGTASQIADWWQAVARSNCQVVAVGGDHFSCMEPPHVSSVVEALAQHIGVELDV